MIYTYASVLFSLKSTMLLSPLESSPSTSLPIPALPHPRSVLQFSVHRLFGGSTVLVALFFFKSWMVFHRMNMPLFVPPSSLDEQLGCFQFGEVMDKATTNILVQLFMWTCPSNVIPGHKKCLKVSKVVTQLACPSALDIINLLIP